MPLIASFVTSSVCLSVCLAVFPQRPERLPCEKRERPEPVCRSGSLFLGAELPSQRLFLQQTVLLALLPWQPRALSPACHTAECSGRRLARPAALCCVQGETKPSCKPPSLRSPCPPSGCHTVPSPSIAREWAGAGLALPSQWCSWRAYKERWESLTSSPL